ncbi:MAG: hypothetical protein AAF394_17605, partial [Planctomycetota bacterium]
MPTLSTPKWQTLTRPLCVLLLLAAPSTLRAQDSDEPKDEAPGINSGLVSPLKFRSLGPALMSGRI